MAKNAQPVQDVRFFPADVAKRQLTSSIHAC